MTTHLTKDELFDFLLGKLELEQSDAISEHLEQCPQCFQTASDLESQADTLLKRLRRSAPAEIDSVGRDAIARIGVTPPSGLAAPMRLRDDGSWPWPADSQVVPCERAPLVALMVSAGLIAGDEFTALERCFEAVAQAADGPSLIAALVQCGALSQFQASAIRAGRLRQLVLGSYVLVDLLGAGGMGHVFQARHRGMDRIVALKVPTKAALNSPEAVNRFRREVRAAAKLIHPNIVTAFDASGQDGVNFLVMEYVPGTDLSQLLTKQGPFTVTQAVNCVLQAARGLAFAHAKGVVHRDIKPSNLLLDDDGVVKILDMGLARLEIAATDAGEAITQAGEVMGTADYMAPEQARGMSPVDAKADIYSLGCTLYRLLTGENMFICDNTVQKLMAHREQPAPPLRSVHSQLPAALGALFQRMVAKQPQHRPTAAEVIATLEQIARGESTATFVESASDALPSRYRPRARPLFLGMAVAGVAVLVVWGIVTVARRNGESGEPQAASNEQPFTAAGPRRPFAPPDGREYVWSKPENLGTAVNTTEAEHLWGVSGDELTLYFANDKPCVARRLTVDQPFTTVASPFGVFVGDGKHGTVSANELALVWEKGFENEEELWVSVRSKRTENFSVPRRAPEPVNLDGTYTGNPVLSADGLTLLARSTRPPSAWGDVWMFRRPALDQPFASAELLPAPVNSPEFDVPHYISNDRLLLIASSNSVSGDDASQPQRIVRYFVRSHPDERFEPGRELDLPLGEATHSRYNASFRLSGDGRTLYFESLDLPGGVGSFDLWRTRRVLK